MTWTLPTLLPDDIPPRDPAQFPAAGDRWRTATGAELVVVHTGPGGVTWRFLGGQPRTEGFEAFEGTVRRGRFLGEGRR